MNNRVFPKWKIVLTFLIYRICRICNTLNLVILKFEFAKICLLRHSILYLKNSNVAWLYLITGRNEVVAKVIFLHLFVILFTGGSLPQCMLRYHIPSSRHPPGADTPWEQTPTREQTPPGADVPQSRHPPEQTPPSPGADSGIRSMSDRYASYWNAFLYKI